MNLIPKQQLIQLNNDFYRQIAPFFSATRQTPWAHWVDLPLPKNGDTVLDVACGNLRFKKFLDERINHFEYLGVDACTELLHLSHQEQPCFQQLDILANFLTGDDWTKQLPRAQYNYIFCSAFFHHVPGADWREQLLRQLFDLLAPGGLLVFTLWQFMVDPNLAKHIVKNLGDNDYLLDWKSGVTATRYCHHFSDEEVTILIDQLKQWGGEVVMDFVADGSTHRMNRYLVVHKP